MDMDEKGLNESIGFVCLLAVVFIIVGVVIIWILPVAIPSFSQNGTNLNGWWLVAFGVIGLIASFWGGSGYRANRESNS
jgi:uncharacterized membrane protein HdeD (DUF308 family)